MSLWVFTLAITPLLVYKEGDVVSALAMGATLYAIALSWYYSIGWSAFVTLIPKGTEGEFGGAYTFVGFVGGWFTPLIIYAVVQATNDARFGILVIDFWCLVGLVYVFFIDFERGKIDACIPIDVNEEGEKKKYKATEMDTFVVAAEKK